MASSRKRESPSKRIGALTDDDLIRYGADDIVAVYMGKAPKDKEDRGDRQYTFVRLTEDVLESEFVEGTAETWVKWYAEKRVGKQKNAHYVLKESNDESYVGMTAIICAVTSDLVEKKDTMEIPDAVRSRIRDKLEQQLSPDYDRSEDKEKQDYEVRMKKRKRQIKRFLGKVGPGDDDNDDLMVSAIASDSDGDDDDDYGPKRKRKKKSESKRAAKEKSKKAPRLTPRPSIKIQQPVWDRKSALVESFNGDSYRASKETIRAAVSGSNELLRNVIKDKKNVADLFVQQSVDVPLNAVDYAIANEDMGMLEMLLNEKDKDPSERVAYPTRSLAEKSSGRHTSRYADYNRRQVGAARGGKEGNNAFTKDSAPKRIFRTDGYQLSTIFQTFDPLSIGFLKSLEEKMYSSNLFNWTFPMYQLLKTGSLKLAHYAMSQLLNKGLGLNKLHVDVLQGPKGNLEEKFRNVSVTKKSDNFGRDSARFCPVHCAAINTHPTFLKELLGVAPEAISCLDSHEATVLHFAAVSEAPKTLKYLLETYPSLNRFAKTRKPKESTLFWAARAGRPANIKLLCSKVPKDDLIPELGALNVEGIGPLHVAVSTWRSGRFDVVRELCRAGLDVDTRADTRLSNKMTATMIATRRGDLDLLKVLVELGADLTATDKLGKTLLMHAAMNGHLHILSFLLKHGVSVEAKDSSDNYAVHYAAAYGWPQCLEMLVQHGNPDPANSWSSTPLSLSLKKGCYACAEVLMNMVGKVDVNVVDRSGRSLFSSAIGAYLSQLSSRPNLPLPWAIEKILEREDLDVGATDTQGRTVLHYIAESAGSDNEIVHGVVSQLLSRGVDVLKADSNGDFSLGLALNSGNLKLAARLIEQGDHTGVHPKQSSFLHLLFSRMGRIKDVDEFVKILKLIPTGGGSGLTDSRGRTPLLVAADQLLPSSRGERDVWSKTKTAFRAALETFPSLITDKLERKSDFNDWNKVLRRIQSRDGKVNWTPRAEYDPSCSHTVFHALCLLDDVEWASEVIEFAISKVNDKDHLKTTLNYKTPHGKTCVLTLLNKFNKFMKEDDASSIFKLLGLLRENGAELNGVSHPFFASVADVQDKDVDMAVALDTATGSDDEKLERVRNYIVARERSILRKRLSKKEKRSMAVEQLQPYSHILIRSPPPQKVFQELLPWMDLEAVDLDGNTALMAAMKGTDLDIDIEYDHISEILLHANINVANKRGESALTISCEKGSVSRAKELLDKGANLNYVSKENGSALHYAVKRNHTEVIEVLLASKKCDLYARDKLERTPLHLAIALAASSRKQELNPSEKQLIEAGADVNAVDVFGRTPIAYCFFDLDTDMLTAFPQIPTRDPVDVLAKLLSLDRMKQQVDNAGRTLLHYAAGAGATICVLSLTETYPSMMDAVDLDKNTPLALALLAERWDAALLLISKGSNLDSDVTKVTRVMDGGNAVERGVETQSTLLHALRAQGALATYMLSANRLKMDTVLSGLFQTSRFSKALEQIKSCREKDMLTSPGRRHSMSPLHLLAESPSFHEATGFESALSDELIKAGVDVAATDDRGLTAVHIAAFHGHENLLKNLVGVHGASVDVRDNSGGTPLSSMFAGKQTSVNLLALLLEASKKESDLVNSQTKSPRNHDAEDSILSAADLEFRLFDTPDGQQKSKEALLRRLEKDKNGGSDKRPKRDRVVSSTVLVEAVRSGDFMLVQVLLIRGADASAQDEDGRTPLHHAAILGNRRLIASLMRSCHSSIDSVDKHGYSAIAYAVLKSLVDGSPALELVTEFLDHGADPQAGNALRLAVKHNLSECALSMIHCLTTGVEGEKRSSEYKVGDFVWSRFHQSGKSWCLATVSRIDEKNPTRLGIMMGALSDVEDGEEYVSLGSDWVTPANEDIDVPWPTKELLFKHQKQQENEEPWGDILEKYSGVEGKLLKHLDESSLAIQNALTIELNVGDDVGLIVGERSNMKMGVGKVVTSHRNGLFDVQLCNGSLKKNIKRVALRKLREELQLKQIPRAGDVINPQLIHDCIRPVAFGSFDSTAVLGALHKAGVSLNAVGTDGKTPLQLARQGSEVQKFLSKHSEQDETTTANEVEMVELPSLGAISLDDDAAASMAKLHEEGADSTEKVVPKVSDVCEIDSEGIYVLEDGDDYFDVALSKVDVEHGRYGKYVFYKMQVVVDPILDNFVLVTNWGRIGERGKYQQTPYSSREESAKEFGKVFKSKTGNAWTSRHEFERKPKKYSLVKSPRTRIKAPEKILGAAVENSTIPCPLDTSLTETLGSLLDVDALMAAVRSSSLNQGVLPLAQLSWETLSAAEQVLRDVHSKLNESKDGDDINKVRDGFETVAKLTNEFYELLPCGDQIVRPFEKDDHRLASAFELIRILRDMSVTKQILLGSMRHKDTMNPIEYAYKALEVRIDPLADGSPEKKSLMRYIDTTCKDDVVVNQIFSLDNGSKPIDSIGNKRLLFHGSKSANIMGILKQGLRIAPPEAPTSGFMYGKGVYFSGEFSKALNYTSGLSPKRGVQPRAFVFVAEVAIGEPYIAMSSEYMEKPKEGTNSTVAPARQIPDPNLDVTLQESGAVVPLGRLKTNSLPDPRHYRWTTSSWNDISSEDSLKIETVRCDSSTEFPATIRITYNYKKYDAVLVSPFSEELSMVEAPPEDADNDDSGGIKSLLDTNTLHPAGSVKATRVSFTIHNSQSEYIVYDTNQIKLKYLIEVTSPSWVISSFKNQNSSPDQNDDDDDDDNLDDGGNGDHNRSGSQQGIFGESSDESDC